MRFLALPLTVSITHRFNVCYTLLAPVFLFRWNYFKNIYTFLLKKFAGVNICCIFTLSN